MFRFRHKIIALLLIFIFFGISGTVVVMTRNYINDKEISIFETNSFVAPNVAAAVGTHLQSLNRSALIFDNLTFHSGRKGNQSQFETLFEDEGVARITVFSQDGKFLSATPEGRDQLPVELIRRFQKTRDRRIESWEGKPLLSTWIGERHYVLELTKKSLEKYFRFVSAFEVSLVTDDGRAVFTNSSVSPQSSQLAMSEELHNLLDIQSKQAVRAMEVRSTSGRLYLAAFSPIPGVDGAAIVVQAPKSEVGELIQKGLQGSILFVSVILVVALFLGVFFSKRVVQPIEDLTEATSKVAKGNWEVFIKNRSKDEIGKLVQSFVEMGQNLKTREAELIRAEKLATLGQFSAGIAHEVKNPLSSILGFAQLAERKTNEADQEDAKAEVKKYLKFIAEETLRANKIVQDLLTFARQKEPELKKEKVSDILSYVYETVVEKAQKIGIQVILQGRELDWSANLDRDQILQVLTNLVSNAIQALEEFEKEGKTVELRLRAENGHVVIEVEDNGPGISEKNQAKIFEPFFSTKKAGKGTGLGLPICHGIIEQHHGKILLCSTLEKGTRFSIHLPLLTAESSAAAGIPAAEDSAVT